MSAVQESLESDHCNEKEGERDAALIRGRFAFNPSPHSTLQLALTEAALEITGDIPPTFSFPTRIPITSALTYRIITPNTAHQQNCFWFLELRQNEAKTVLQCMDFGEMGCWKKLMRKHVNKFGFWEDFKPVRRISKGISSAVFEVFRIRDGKRFAVKAFPKAQLQQSQSLFSAMEKEIRMLREVQKLKHTHLLGIEEVYSSQNSYYLVMELCGNDLLRGGRQSDGSKPMKVRQAMRQLLSGLAALHDNGVIHRDIKPNNIMFRASGSLQLVITDFGLATYLGEDHPFVRCGTPGYVAPEVFQLSPNDKLTNFAADIFSMGVVFHLLLTGEHLFKANNSKDLFLKNSTMDFDLTHSMYEKVEEKSMDLMRKMLEKDPKVRITAGEALKHQYFAESSLKLQSPAPTFQSLNHLAINEQEFSEIDLMGLKGRKRQKAEYRKASET